MALRQEAAPTIDLNFSSDSYRDEGRPPLASEFFDEADEFEDAAEYQSSMDLQTAFNDCEVAIRKFFNNDLVGAANIMKPWSGTSLYHSLGTSIFEFIPAILMFDQAKINQALAAIKVCISICNQHRRNYTLIESLGTIIKKPNYGTYTDMEAHAELCHAEALLLQAAMTIIDGEDLTGLIKGTLKVKNCYKSYKDCAKILEAKKWESQESRIHFHSGVRLGIAAFNVMISLLPPKIISLLEFVGFSGDKNFGLMELEAGSRSPGLRSVLCDLTLLGYHLVICQFIGANGDLELCEEILNKTLQKYPEGVWFLVFKGRLEFLKGMFRPSIATYNRAIVCQHTWPQFSHLCFWDVLWINGLMMEWREAAAYASKLIEESSWSRTIYSYIKSAMLLQLGDQMSHVELQQCSKLMRNASEYKQRIAGKSLPMEKFMIRRCARFQAQGGQLVLPALELICLWNMFPILARNDREAQKVLKLIESTRRILDFGSQDWMAGYQADNRALLRYLHGCCLAAMGLPRMAVDIMDTVFELKGEIKEDMFLLPYTLVEMAMCYHQLGDRERALQMLQDARKKYNGYALESRLHFRMHSKLQIIKNDDYNGRQSASSR